VYNAKADDLPPPAAKYITHEMKCRFPL